MARARYRIRTQRGAGTPARPTGGWEMPMPRACASPLALTVAFTDHPPQAPAVEGLESYVATWPAERARALVCLQSMRSWLASQVRRGGYDCALHVDKCVEGVASGGREALTQTPSSHAAPSVACDVPGPDNAPPHLLRHSYRNCHRRRRLLRDIVPHMANDAAVASRPVSPR
jgi:hypothetical protein